MSDKNENGKLHPDMVNLSARAKIFPAKCGPRYLQAYLRGLNEIEASTSSAKIEQIYTSPGETSRSNVSRKSKGKCFHRIGKQRRFRDVIQEPERHLLQAERFQSHSEQSDVSPFEDRSKKRYVSKWVRAQENQSINTWPMGLASRMNYKRRIPLTKPTIDLDSHKDVCQRHKHRRAPSQEMEQQPSSSQRERLLRVVLPRHVPERQGRPMYRPKTKQQPTRKACEEELLDDIASSSKSVPYSCPKHQKRRQQNSQSPIHREKLIRVARLRYVPQRKGIPTYRPKIKQKRRRKESLTQEELPDDIASSSKNVQHSCAEHQKLQQRYIRKRPTKGNQAVEKYVRHQRHGNRTKPQKNKRQFSYEPFQEGRRMHVSQAQKRERRKECKCLCHIQEKENNVLPRNRWQNDNTFQNRQMLYISEPCTKKNEQSIRKHRHSLQRRPARNDSQNEADFEIFEPQYGCRKTVPKRLGMHWGSSQRRRGMHWESCQRKNQQRRKAARKVEQKVVTQSETSQKQTKDEFEKEPVGTGRIRGIQKWESKEEISEANLQEKACPACKIRTLTDIELKSGKHEVIIVKSPAIIIPGEILQTVQSSNNERVRQEVVHALSQGKKNRRGEHSRTYDESLVDEHEDKKHASSIKEAKQHGRSNKTRPRASPTNRSENKSMKRGKITGKTTVNQELKDAPVQSVANDRQEKSEVPKKHDLEKPKRSDNKETQESPESTFKADKKDENVQKGTKKQHQAKQSKEKSKKKIDKMEASLVQDLAGTLGKTLAKRINFSADEDSGEEKETQNKKQIKGSAVEVDEKQDTEKENVGSSGSVKEAEEKQRLEDENDQKQSLSEQRAEHLKEGKENNQEPEVTEEEVKESPIKSESKDAAPNKEKELPAKTPHTEDSEKAKSNLSPEEGVAVKEEPADASTNKDNTPMMQSTEKSDANIDEGKKPNESASPAQEGENIEVSEETQQEITENDKDELPSKTENEEEHENDVDEKSNVAANEDENDE